MTARRMAIALAVGLASTSLVAVSWAQQGVVFNESLGIDLSQMNKTPRGVYWLDIQVGKGFSVDRGARLVIHYAGWLPDGTLFDSSKIKNQPVELKLGDARVIKGWEDGIRGMKEGGVRVLVIPPKLGYGSKGVAPLIPPDATLIFQIELVRASR